MRAIEFPIRFHDGCDQFESKHDEMSRLCRDGDSSGNNESENVRKAFGFFRQQQFVAKRFASRTNGNYFCCGDLRVAARFDIFFSVKSGLNLVEKSFCMAANFAEDSFTWVSFPVLWLA